MKLSTIFRRAAEYLDGHAAEYHHGACAAIDHVTRAREDKDAAFQFFTEHLAPDNAAPWFLGREDGTLSSDRLFPEEAKARRVLALLFAAEVAKSEGL